MPDILSRTVYRSGSSLALTIPAALAAALSIQAGTEVRWELTRGGLILRRQEAGEGES